ncbi:hypothetical protein JZ751_013905 [Albula glossodonta]|uniref:Uncharacterized protein n=1 Tax=Albula glossodonta TaxID=121402 RepID=A0A8T2MXG6_9TELE|nr:hypothetical protein JZ751_013905 [Albula glossodonta]
MLATMDNNRNADRRALLVACREKWSRVEEQPTPRDTASGPAGKMGSWTRQWIPQLQLLHKWLFKDCLRVFED